MDAKTKLWMALAIVAFIALAVIGVVVNNNAKLAEENKVALEQKAQLEAEAKALAQLKAETEGKLAEANEQKELLIGAVGQLQGSVEEKDKLISELETKLEETPSEPVGGSFAYVEDDLILGGIVPDVLLSDNKLSTLLDVEVEFDGELYNVEESVLFSGLKLALGNDDYNGEAFLEVPVEGVFYKLQFDSSLPTNDIGLDDEYLSFNFLGEEVTVKEWDGTKLVLTRGVEYTLKEGELLVVDENTVLVNFISENDKVSVTVNSETATLSEGQTKELGGVDVHVDSVLTNSRGGIVVLKIGSDVFETVHLGDEFEEDSVWVWYIDEANRQLGLKLDEEFKYFDEDEDFNAFGYGQALALPKSKVVMTFLGLDTVESQELFMDYSSKEGTEYVRLKGEFESGVEKYTRLYISKVTDEIFGLNDENDLELLGNRVELKNSDFEILATVSDVAIVEKSSSVELATFDKEFVYAKLDGFILSGDDNHLGVSGIRIKNIEDSEEDEKFSFSVPEETVFASLGFN